jgi:nitroimidazol reductase NimA-like FMN-containing flavoprotein (pyridoxamine 5'-phosphate oxidase superfamily)
MSDDDRQGMVFSSNSRVRELCDQQPLAVMATSEPHRPLLSLMAFAATPDLKTLVVVTSKKTRKYLNLMTDGRVSLLMDNRSNRPVDFQEACSITALGTAEEVSPEERPPWRELFLAKHPHLSGFVDDSDSALIKIAIERYIVVSRFQDVQEFPV